MSEEQAKATELPPEGATEAPQGGKGAGGILKRYGSAIMVVVGVVTAGAVAYFVNAGLPFEHHASASRASLVPPEGVVYIDADRIMADVIAKMKTGQIAAQQSGEVGAIVGETIQSAAKAYGDRGYIVLSRYVLAAPARDDVTAPVEALVMKRISAYLATQKTAEAPSDTTGTQGAASPSEQAPIPVPGGAPGGATQP
jgi:mRNA-degrading endonuclease toxin of MazEF toxin-antitoxin module